MAVDIKKTYYGWTDTSPIALGHTVSIEGQALMGVIEDGVEKVLPTSGSVGTVVGFARFRQLSFAVDAIVESGLVVPHAAPFTVELSKQNLLAGQWLIKADDGLAWAVAPVVDEVHGIVTFDGADKDRGFSINYRYEMTVSEAKNKYYEAPVNHPDANIFMQVGVGKGKSRIYTLHYDASVDWTTATPKAGEAGILAARGLDIAGARVIQVPSQFDPFLGIEVNV